MARKRFRGRRRGRKRVARRGRRMRKTISKYSQGQIVHVRQKVLKTTLTFSNSYQTYGYYFSVSDLPQVSSWQLVFDQYKILGVKVEYVPVCSAANINTLYNGNALALQTLNSQFNPIMQCVIDYDDASALGSENAALAYANCKTYRIYRPWKRYFRPHVAAAVYSSGGFVSSANKRSPWIDFNSPTTQHFGMKIFMDAGSNNVMGGNIGFIYCTYYIAMKNII